MNDYADDIVRAAGQTCARIGGYAGDLTGDAPVPGGVIVLADRTRQIGQVTFGHADLERGLPMTLDRRFEIGSISKIFTSLLAGQFAAESRLSLDDPVSGFLPWLDLGARARPATLRSLLNHTAGLVIGSDALPDDLAQIWRMRNLAVDPEAGRFHYSNLGFQILGLALGALAGEPVTDLVRSRLLEPIGMADSIPAVTNADRPGLAVGYTAARQDRPWAPGDPLAPAAWFEVATADGNIAATGPDLARLVRLLLGRGEVDGRRVVAESVIEAMVTSLAPDGEPITQLPGLPPVTSSRYGLGINVETIGGDQCLTHGGGMVGYSTFLLADVSAQVGVVVLTNADGDGLYAQMLARLAHADLVARLSGGAEPALPGVDPTVRGGDQGAPGGAALGRFTADQAAGQAPEFTLAASRDDALVLTTAHGSGRLFRTLTGRYVTDHPDLRRFPLDLAERDGRPAWISGPAVYRPAGPAPAAGERAGGDPAGTAVPAAWRALAGHYRCYSPWYPEFRVFVRDGSLWLAASGGTEAPGQDEPLIEVAPGEFRIGAEEWLPERLTAGPVVDGRVISVTRDGCEYSRSFTP